VLVTHESVRIGHRALACDLAFPAGAGGVVVFAHGSGSSRFSPRNRSIAEVLQAQRLATLLLDLLAEDEADDRRKVFDIPLLAARLAEAIDWCRAQPRLGALRLGLFGASTGAAAALVAAAARPTQVAAVVSRGGRPDLAGSALQDVRAPTLLVVGGDDDAVVALNRDTLTEMRCAAHLQIVPGATHLFEEPGTLEAVATLAADWFVRHLIRRAGMVAEREAG
jgi:putative phosphoribosyl transferase